MLADCNGRMNWPTRGIYFFCEAGEARSSSGAGLRIVRVGTHGLKAGSRSKLWARLSQHRGTARSSDGNHRGSIFRGLVGKALAQRQELHPPPARSHGRGRFVHPSTGPRYSRKPRSPTDRGPPVARRASVPAGGPPGERSGRWPAGRAFRPLAKSTATRPEGVDRRRADLGSVSAGGCAPGRPLPPRRVRPSGPLVLVDCCAPPQRTSTHW